MGNVHPTGILLKETKRRQGFRARCKKDVGGEVTEDCGFSPAAGPKKTTGPSEK
jgi:hypothetical protein